VAHDLRAPLRNIHGYATAILEDESPRLSEEGALYAKRMAQSAERMDDLIQDLLEYSRLSRAALAMEPVDLDSVVREALEDLSEDIRERNALVEVQAGLPRVLGHRATVGQVVTNLLSNALKFVAPGDEAHVTVSSNPERRGDWVGLDIRDCGIGIPHEHHRRIFGVFERLHGSDSYPGTGIGLAIVRKGVERMGGSVDVESTPGQGTRFTIWLPSAT